MTGRGFRDGRGAGRRYADSGGGTEAGCEPSQRVSVRGAGRRRAERFRRGMARGRQHGQQQAGRGRRQQGGRSVAAVAANAGDAGDAGLVEMALAMLIDMAMGDGLAIGIDMLVGMEALGEVVVIQRADDRHGQGEQRQPEQEQPGQRRRAGRLGPAARGRRRRRESHSAVRQHSYRDKRYRLDFELESRPAQCIPPCSAATAAGGGL